MGSLATILSSAVVALDPPPVDSRQPRPAREIDMAKVTPLMEAITPIFTNDAVASNSVPFILDGVIYGMRITHDPKLQEALFALLNTTADRFLATSKDPFKLESFRPFIITRLEEGKREDLKAYGKKLREKYLPKP
jgi:hypothetical protein